MPEPVDGQRVDPGTSFQKNSPCRPNKGHDKFILCRYWISRFQSVQVWYQNRHFVKDTMSEKDLKFFLGNYTDIQGLNQTKKRVRLWSEGIRDRSPVRDNKKYSIFYWEYFWAISTQVRTEHALLLPMNLMGEPLANYVKSLDCQCELSSKARTKTGNVLLLIRVPTNNW